MIDQSKPYDIRINSVNAIPDILMGVQLMHEARHGLIDFHMSWHTNDEKGYHPTTWQALFYKEDGINGIHLVFLDGIGDYAKRFEIPFTIDGAAIKTCDEAKRVVNDKSSNDMADVLKGLKAVQRELRKMAHSLAAFRDKVNAFDGI